MKVSLINGPNLNMLGERDPQIYGNTTLAEIVEALSQEAEKLKITLSDFQSNSEGALVDAIQKAVVDKNYIIINAAAYSHTSIAIRDALECSEKPIVEVHLSNIYKREEFRKKSLISEVSQGVISGFGAHSYLLALQAVAELAKK